MEETLNPICHRCYCYWKPDETDIKTSGLVYSTCKRCRTNKKVSRTIYRKEIKEARKIYYEKTKCEHNKSRRGCSICNLPLYLLNLQRLHIRRCLKSSTQNKTKSSIEYLGCDADYFKDYIQKKMDIYNETAEVKMDFANIHIDHIKPVSTFNLDDEEEFLDCCNYTNLQPLLIKDNLSKFNKWTDDDNKYWNENIKGKEHLEIYLKMI